MDAREYRRLALEHHPNRPGGSTEAFLKLRAQYENKKKNKKNVGDDKRIAGPSPRLAIQNPPPSMRSPAFQTWMREQFSQRPSAVGMRVRGWRSPMHMLEAARRVPPGFDGCAPTENSIAVSQAVVYLAARVRAAQQNVGETGGLLALHSTGSGKTLIGLAVLLAFWDSPVGVLFVSTPTNQRDNSAEVLGLLAVRFFPDFVSRTSQPARPFAPGTTPLVAAKRIEARLRRGMRERLIDPAHARVFAARSRPGLYTFKKLANDIGIFRRGQLLKDAVFVIDEAHYLNDPKMPGAAAVRRLLTTGRDSAATWCVAMTATPGETRADVATLLNAVAGSSDAFAPDRPFFPAARGMVSVARLETDGSRFARVRTTFAAGPNGQPLAPSPAFAAAKRRKTKDTEGGYSKAARDADHFAIVQGGTAVGVQVVQKRTQTVRTWIPGPKIEALLAYIQRHEGLHYVYSGSVKTAQLVATLLKTRLGMTHYRPRRCRVRGRCEDPFPAPGSNAFVTLDDLGSAAFSPFDALAPLTPQVVAARRHVVRAASEGTVKVVVATRESFKGVDIRGVRHVHALDPFENYKDYLQLIGRGPRLCAHADIPDMSKRVVDVVVYLTTNGANARVFRGAETRYRAAWGAIDDELGRAAVDKEIFL